MEDTRVTFETAKLAKEKGFDALCYDASDKNYNTYEEALEIGLYQALLLI